MESKYIKGSFSRSFFEGNNGYLIGLLKLKETNIDVFEDYINKTVTFTGYFDSLNPNDTYILYGMEVEHPRFGLQFNVISYEKVKPTDKLGVIAFLSSDLFPGIGEKMATSIVDTLGEKAMEEILEDKSVLMLVPRLSMKKADLIYSTLVKYEESHKTIVYLTELGFNMRDSLAIYNCYKERTINIIENNPYQLIDDVDEITFPKIDAIYSKVNIESDSIERIKACLFYVMNNITFETGDTYMQYEDIYNGVCKYLHLDLERGYVEELLTELSMELKIVIKDNAYYLYDLYTATDNIVSKIKYLVQKEPSKYKEIDDMLQELETYNGIKYNDKQVLAIKKALTNNVTIITGGPGTGKTMIIKAIVDLYRSINNYSRDVLTSNVALLAPTGRASKRLSESTNMPASTIHRFLKWNRESNTFNVNEYNPDFSHLIIVDEVSMIDIYLMDSLLKGLTDNIKLVLVGDHNQLPSVGPGMLLKDLIDSEVVDTVNLDILYRQKEDSYIPVLANEIRTDDLGDYLTTKDDYTFLPCNGSAIIPNLTKICKQIIDKGYDYRRAQVMAPMYAGVNGIDNLNRVLQDIFNPGSTSKKEIKYGDVTYRENDKVLQLVNDPDNNVFNGDIGVITSIKTGMQTKTGKSEIVIDFDSNLVTYQVKDLSNIKHGFIISIHKSQGSEFDLVIIPMTYAYHRMLYRKLIYTGVTRAKKKLIIIGEPNTFEACVHNNNEQLRNTDLLNKIRKACFTQNN